MIETLTQGLEITNTLPGSVQGSEASIVPSSFEPAAACNYTLYFSPQNYQQNMYMVLTLPKQIDFSQNAVKCYGLAGTDNDQYGQLKCEIDKTKRTITIKNFVEFQRGNPGDIEILIETLVNPVQNILTDSFVLQTFTHEGYSLDQMDENLAVNFFCEYPCATCHQTWTDECYSCYGQSDYKIYHDY